MLDTTDADGKTVPNARAFAKVRTAFAAKKLESTLADAVLTALDGDADTAAKLAHSVAQIVQLGAVAKLSAEETQTAILDALADPKADTSDAFMEAARDRINMAWKAAGDADIPMHGRSNADVGRDGGDRFRESAIADVTARLAGKPAKMQIPDLLMTCARSLRARPSTPLEAARMSGLWTTSDFGAIFDTALTNDLGRRLATAEIAIQRAARVTESPDYRQRRMLQASGTTMPQEVPEGAEIKHVVLTESGQETIKLRDFGGLFAMSRQAFLNDSTAMGLLQDMASRMAQGAMERKRAVLLEPLLANSGAGQTMSDGKAMFHADHGNVAASATALSVDAIGAGVTKMMRLRGPNGEPLAVRPRYLVVPPELALLAAQVLATVAATKTADVNPISGTLEIIVEAGLTDPTAWYLVADPAVYDGLVLGFLEGQTGPRVESREGWNTFSVEWRIDWPMDSAFSGTAAWFKNPGA